MDFSRGGRHNPDIVLLIVVLVLCIFGLLMVYSSSMSDAREIGKDPAYFFVRQGRAFLLGLVALLVAVRVDYRTWRRFAWPVFFVAAGLLVTVLLWGKEGPGGSRRWLFSTSIQPSEFAKLAVVLFCAGWLPRKGDDVRTLGYGLIPFGILIGFISGLILREPDLGTASIVMLTAGAMFVVAGADLLQVVFAGGLTGFVLYMTAHTYQLERLGYFWDPCSEQNPKLVQVCQGIIAMGSGGISGLGLGESRWRWEMSLPYSDSILAIVGEELGLIGTTTVVLLFALVVYRGFRIALQTPDSFGRLLATGITLWLAIQACVNLGGNVALLPFTGVPLPFISYGGSALVSVMFASGLLLNISRYTQLAGAVVEAPLQRIAHAPVDYGRRDRGARVPGTFRRGGIEGTAAR